MPEPREHDLLLLPLELLGRGLENLSAGDQLLGGVCGFYRLELLFDILTQSPVTNEREVSKHQFLRRACDRLRKLRDCAVCYGNERLSVLGIEQRHHRPGQVARKEDAIAMRQPGFTLHFLTKRLAEGYGAGNFDLPGECVQTTVLSRGLTDLICIVHRALRDAHRDIVYHRPAGLRVFEAFVAALRAHAADM